MSVILFLDGNFLCHRARHTTGGLQHEGVPTGVAFGFIRDVQIMVDLHVVDTVVATFDGGGGIRYTMSPSYKESRRTKIYTPEEEAANKAFTLEMQTLRKEILPDLGFRNIWRQRGYEGDDLIAAGVLRLEDAVDEAIIVTADNDLWQCLRPNVRWWNPITKKTITYKSFKSEWGLEPACWAHVKAIAGCKGDDVKGVPGIGEKTAAKWLRGLLKENSKASLAIDSQIHLHNANMKLVRLPLPGCDPPKIVPDDRTSRRSRDVMQRLGIRSAGRERGFI